MASAFGHAFSAIVLGTGLKKTHITWKVWLLGVACSLAPDADIILLKLGVPYESFWGHRGISHSILFAFIAGAIVTTLFFRKHIGKISGKVYFLYFSICTASHGVLDALTNGGLGIAFFSPWDNGRYFFPWHPIQVSPLVAGSFFGERGLLVIMTELKWLGIPGIVIMVCFFLYKKYLSHPRA